MITFQQIVAVITGAGSGIGRELALQLAQRGAHLAIADIQEAPLRETADFIEQHNIPISTHILDVSQREAVYRFADEVSPVGASISSSITGRGVKQCGVIT
jgi:NAD(P)-dependent dehydrogenase (short-subunit alcohol dehydrogenase family)